METAPNHNFSLANLYGYGKRINTEGINQSHVIFPVPNALISLGGDTVNKIDHYKIHEVQKS